MKKISLLTLTCLFIACVFCSVGNAAVIKVTIDGKVLQSDIPAQIVSERTVVPLRAIFEALGASVNWNGEERSISAEKGTTSIYMKIDQKNFTVNGVEKTLDVPATIIGGRTMVPARAISESLGCRVVWDNISKTVIITSNVGSNSSESVSSEDVIAAYTAIVKKEAAGIRDYYQAEADSEVNNAAEALLPEQVEYIYGSVEEFIPLARYSVYDIDKDGIPELITYKPNMSSSGETAYMVVYTYKDGKAQSCGEVSSGPVFAKTYDKGNGVYFWYQGGGVFYTLNGTNLIYESEFNDDYEHMENSGVSIPYTRFISNDYSVINNIRITS